MNPRNRMVPQPTNPYSLNRQLMQDPGIGGGDSGISRSKTPVTTFSVSLSDSKAGKNTTAERETRRTSQPSWAVDSGAPAEGYIS